MPTVKLIFHLPEDQAESRWALDGHKYHSALWEFIQDLRTQREHEEHSKDVAEMLDKIWDELWQILNNREIADQF